MLKTLIVDDELGARQTLSGMLNQYCPEIQIVGMASNVREARTLIKEKNPDLIFLDIQMPFESGFDLLDSLDSYPFHIVFTTAYNNYALKAIKFSALDYILKPINLDELIAAVGKASKTTINTDQFSILRAHQNDENEERIVLRFKDGFRVVNCREIVRFEGDRNYSWVHLVNGEKTLVAKTLKEFEELLTKYNFFRVHQSHLINLKCVREYIKGRGGTIRLIDGSEVDLARSRKQDFLNYFEQ